MRLRLVVWGLLSLVAAGLFARAFPPLRAGGATAPLLPLDPKAWIGPPQSWDALRGRVVLLDVWTFG